MCGICAVFAYDPNAPAVDERELLSIRDSMAARGPDGEGTWFGFQGRVGLGHRRLSIIDLSPSANQPMLSPKRELAIVFNGEIYNYRELRASLEQQGYRFLTSSDTEVLLHLYAHHGQEMVSKLRGMFAFAIWDGVKRGLFAARDPFGIKPLYIADDGQSIRIASQVKALLAGGRVDTHADAAGHVGFFLWGHIPEPFTLYRTVRALPAGSTLWLGADGSRREQVYCSISQVIANAAADSQPAADPAHVRSWLRSALQDTVAHHLVADVPVGVFLSAGLDSTTLAAHASELGGQLQTVTLGFREYRGTENDEAPLAEIVARQCNARHQTVWVSQNEFLMERDRLFAAMDQPTIDGVNTYFVSLAARRVGLKVCISGLGGDELFGGYPSFRQIPRIVRMLRLFPPENPGGRALRKVSAPIVRRFTSPKYAGLLEYGGRYSGAYLLRRGLFMPWELPTVLDADFVRQGWRDLQPLVRLDETVGKLTSDRAAVSALEMAWYMRNQLLRDADWAGMAHSLEIRVPFVDIELLRTLAPSLAAASPPTKRDLARTPDMPLPDSVVQRQKTGFQIPVRDWLMRNGAAVSPSDLPERGLRGWARHVYDQFKVNQPFSASHMPSPLPAARYAQPLPSTTRRLPPSPRILVFRMGQLGDTIVALPAMWAIKDHFSDASLTLLCDRHPGKAHVLAADLLRDTGIFDAFESYDVDDTGRGRRTRVKGLLRLTLRLRRRRFDTLVYLAPSIRTPSQIARDRKYFALLGIKRFLGMKGFPELPRKVRGKPLTSTPSEVDLLLARLAQDGVAIPSPGRGSLELCLGPKERAEVTEWLTLLPGDGLRPWIGIGPGSKMPAKRWPEDRYRDVVNNLIADQDIWPVVFGGNEDRALGDRLLHHWGRGYNAAGSLSLRGSAAGLERCLAYVGNDTGTMHLAAAVGTPCVAVFSARHAAGSWYPYGEGHRVFQVHLECEGCLLVECLEKNNECLRGISVEQVTDSCLSVLRERITARGGIRAHS